MNRTFSELCEELKRIDEITLLELLEISSEEIVDKFEDKIEDKLDKLLYNIDSNEIEELNLDDE
jgi:hypothetical protein